MIKANSPTCVSEKPDCTATFNGWPASTTPSVPKNTCPASTRHTSSNIGPRYSHSIAGSTIIPTDTKNIAPNRSFTGCTSFSMLALSVVSASSDPITNAPSAAEKPAFVASITIPRQNASATTSSVSPFKYRFTRFSSVGTR